MAKDLWIASTIFTSSAAVLALTGMEWERLIAAVGVPSAILAAMGWFFWRVWREFAPIVREWLQSQIENDKVHRREVERLSDAYREMVSVIERLLVVAERNGEARQSEDADESRRHSA